MRIRRGLVREDGGVEEEGLIIIKIKWERERWKVRSVYIREKIRQVLEKIKVVAEKERRGRVDFNTRMGEKGTIEEEEEGKGEGIEGQGDE